MKQVTVVFLMGGKGQRFGGKFKPFLKIFDKTFLELAIQPFLKHKDSIKEMIFLTTQAQMDEFRIGERIIGFNLPSSLRTVVVGTDKADGIIGDINKLIGDRSGLNDVIFCDCDHSLNVDDIFDWINADNSDVILPAWEIKPEEVNKWSISTVKDGIVSSISEKEFPTIEVDEEYAGIIGCYYFKLFPKAPDGMKYISQMVEWFVQGGKTVRAVPITEAEFFGDPERLKQLYEEKKASTIFCDIDGTIIEHESEPNYTSIKLLDGAGEKIKDWRDDNCFIILTTSRDEQFRPEMEKLLRDAGIRYESLVMGLPTGTRHLINDTKPYADVPMAVAHNVERNKGIKNLDIGHSFANLELKDKIIYKKIDQNSSTYQIKKLEAQYKSLRTIAKLPGLSHLVPKVYEFKDCSFGMEYLDGYVGLHQVQDRVSVLHKLFINLQGLYSHSFLARTDWLKEYLEEKIFAKAMVIKDLGLDAVDIFKKLERLSDEEYKLLSPDRMVSYYHGDLTYENIRVKNGEIKLIDTDNDNLPGCPEQDLGKLIQSARVGYEFWDGGDFKINEQELYLIRDFYSAILNNDLNRVEKKALFYCATHLIRMIPYQFKTSPERAQKALSLARELLVI